MTALLRGTALTFRYGAMEVFRDVSFALERGELVALVGPNGAGKSTLLKVLIGWLAADSGTVELGGTPIGSLSRREIARRAAFMAQDSRVDFSFSVRELVTMGRTPHTGRFRPEGPEDLRAVERALAATETVALADRSIAELSGGERQRAHLARALAQETDVLLLDEPTASLDIEHQLGLLSLVRALVREGRSALVAMHDLSLAARYADRVILLAGAGIVAAGPPAEVFTEVHLAEWFRIRARVRQSSEDGSLELIPLEPLSPSE